MITKKEKSPSLSEYYDGWGNRCYLFSAEIGTRYYFTAENETVLTESVWDHEVLKKAGCDYILSGLEIANPQDSGLEFVDEFTHEDSPYRIRLTVFSDVRSLKKQERDILQCLSRFYFRSKRGLMIRRSERNEMPWEQRSENGSFRVFPTQKVPSFDQGSLHILSFAIQDG